jgi:hypothetical protein
LAGLPEAPVAEALEQGKGHITREAKALGVPRADVKKVIERCGPAPMRLVGGSQDLFRAIGQLFPFLKQHHLQVGAQLLAAKLETGQLLLNRTRFGRSCSKMRRASSESFNVRANSRPVRLLADVTFRLGDVAAGEQVLRQILELDPADRKAEELINAIEQKRKVG